MYFYYRSTENIINRNLFTVHRISDDTVVVVSKLINNKQVDQSCYSIQLYQLYKYFLYKKQTWHLFFLIDLERTYWPVFDNSIAVASTSFRFFSDHFGNSLSDHLNRCQCTCQMFYLLLSLINWLNKTESCDFLP